MASFSSKRVLLAGILGVLLCGCASDPSSFPYSQLSPVPPPEAPFEEKQASENPAAETWRPGHWSYNGIDFAWVSGQLISRPSASAVWSADRWERREYGWAFVPGYWQ